MKHATMKQILIIFIIFYHTNSKIFEIKKNTYENIRLNYLLTILQRYEGFDLIIHVFGNNYDLNFLHGSTTTTKWPISIYNYRRTEKFVRPEVSQAVHLIYCLNEKITSILAESGRITPSDVVIFVSRENIRNKITSIGDNLLKISGKVLLIHNNEIFKICYYCGAESKKFIQLHSYQLKDSDIFPSQFTNLNGHILKICMIYYFPIITCDQNVTRPEIIQRNKSLLNVECLKVSGIEGKLLKVVSNSLNFTSKVFFITPDAGWFDMIQVVNKNEVDLAIGGISITAERIPLVQFTQIFNYENLNLMYMFDLKFSEIFDNFMSPFKASFVWSLYLVSFFIVSWILYLTWKINIRTKQVEVSFLKSLWTILLIVIEQSNPYINRFYQSRISCGMVLSCWWCCSLIFSTMYKSTVLSATAYPPNLEPQDLDGVLKAGYKIVANQQSADLVREMLNSQDKIYKNKQRKIIYGKDVCDVFTKIFPGHVAMLAEQNTIQYEVRSTCATCADDAKLEHLRMCKKPVGKTGHAWATQLTAPYTNAINQVIMLVIEAGLLKQWNKEAIHGFQKNQIHFAREQKTKGIEVLSLKRVSPLFLLYSIGISFSIFAFIIELTIFKHCTLKNKIFLN